MVLHTLRDVIANAPEIIRQFEKDGKCGGNKDSEAFSRAIMDKIVVFDDLTLKKYLAYNYIFDTHIMPNRLPGVGVSIGDIIKHENETYLTIDFNVMFANIAALHYARKHELLYLEWHNKKDEMNHRVRNFVDHIKQLDENCFGFDELKDFSVLGGRVRWDPIDTPSPSFLKGLDKFSKTMGQRRKKGMRSLAREASALVKEMSPYSMFESFMIKLRKDIGHKGFPSIEEGMLRFNTPAASGGANWHTHLGDDLVEAIPSYNDLFLVATQAGNTFMHYLYGSGHCPGEHYFMLLPKTPFFKLIQERVNTDENLVKLQKKILNYKSAKKCCRLSNEWTAATMSIKQDVLKEILPKIVLEQVLGFHVDMNSERMVALVRPIVSESHLALNNYFSLPLLRQNFTDLLFDEGKNYSKLGTPLTCL